MGDLLEAFYRILINKGPNAAIQDFTRYLVEDGMVVGEGGEVAYYEDRPPDPRTRPTSTAPAEEPDLEFSLAEAEGGALSDATHQHLLDELRRRATAGSKGKLPR